MKHARKSSSVLSLAWWRFTTKISPILVRLRSLRALDELILTEYADIKPAAILADYGSRLGSSSKNNVHKVQLGRFEDAILPYLSKERIDQYRVSIEDLPWKSPEFWIRALQTRPSDVFSFGLTSVNFMLNNLKLLCPDTGFQLKRLAALGGIGRGVPTPSLLAKLQIWFNYFGDADALMGLLEQVKDEPNRWYGPLSKHVKESAFGTRKPLPGLGNHHDPGFVDVVTKMTHLDPRKRITAREALEHEWFANITVGPEHVWFSPFIPLKQPDTREALDTVQNGLPMRKIPTEPQHIPIRSFPAYTPPISDDPSTPLQEDEGESAVLKVAREDGEKHLPPAKNVIRKVYTPLNESALERYRNFAGRGPNPATLRKRVFKLEKPEPLAIPIKEINRF
ncbi:hypothetical protein QBC41DRAFT_313135 [Cercophora samala]|uniref:Protein kinase domain-containing protein n=1 Tax=Cercophora samala TaxID=330535 RepID=A0AA40DFS8_9PEZI|nr:hypothetical protein QBC41DRAFT_313135 [Cercophora samala]